MKKMKYNNSDLLKDRLVWFTSIGLTTVIILLMMMSVVIAQQTEEKEVVVTIIRINGTLNYRESATADWQQAKVKQILYDGYQIKKDRVVVPN